MESTRTKTNSDPMESLKEMLEFLQPSQRIDIKSLAAMNLLCLSGSKDGCSSILSLKEMVEALLYIAKDSASNPQDVGMTNDVILILVNLSAETFNAHNIHEIAKDMKPSIDIIDVGLREVIRKNSSLAEAWSKVLSNMTRDVLLNEVVLDHLEMDSQLFKDLCKVYATVHVRGQKPGLHYLSSVFCNLTQSGRGRDLICRTDLVEQPLFDKILSFVHYDKSLIRRGGAIGILKNLCFDSRFHKRLLTDTDDEILSAIMYPLCGPEEYTDEENEKLPLDLQYLPAHKKREVDPDLRKMLLDSLLQLCATRPLREYLRSKNVYEILREYHKWESANEPIDRLCLLSCENVVNILIRKEEEIGCADYKDVSVPEELTASFIKEDEDYLKGP